MSRFRQAISEGDGISVVPVLEGEVEDLAALAEEAGAEAVAVALADVGRVRASTSLAVLVRGGDPSEASASGADANNSAPVVALTVNFAASAPPTML